MTSECLNRTKVIATSWAGGPRPGGMLVDLNTESSLKAGLHACLETGNALTTKSARPRTDQQLADESYVDKSGASESMTVYPTGFEITSGRPPGIGWKAPAASFSLWPTTDDCACW